MSTATATKKTGRVTAANAKVYNVRHSLDSLAKMSSSQLDVLYRDASMPVDLSVLDGRPKGRMLAVNTVDQTILREGIRRLTALNVFPWDGKSFSRVSATEGRGVNRVKLLFASRDWFPFTTRVQPSAIDGKPCIYLDYEQPENPWFISKIHDEIRCVAPGVYMGPAMWKRKGEPLLILWFAVDFNHES